MGARGGNPFSRWPRGGEGRGGAPAAAARGDEFPTVRQEGAAREVAGIKRLNDSQDGVSPE